MTISPNEYPRMAPLERPLAKHELRALRKLWDRIPGVRCRRLCAAACTNAPIMPVEAYYLMERYPGVRIRPGEHGGLVAERRVYPTLGAPGEPCPFLDGTDCTVYEDRPIICRVYGHRLAALDCGQGCRESRPIDAIELAGWLYAALRILEPALPRVFTPELWADALARSIDGMTVSTLVDDDDKPIRHDVSLLVQIK